MSESVESRIGAQLRPGMRVAVADGPGAPVELLEPLAEAARQTGDISLLLGWCLDFPADLDLSAFTDVRTLMGGFALRALVEAGRVHYVPERLRGIPATVTGPLRPDALLVALSPDAGHWHWGTEVSWMAAVADLGVPLIAVANEALPRTSAEPALPDDQVTVVARSSRHPVELPRTTADKVSDAIGGHIAALVPEGAAIQVGPGSIGDAVLRSLSAPVRVHTGMITDAVADLDAAGLLLGPPRGAYVAGTRQLSAWADGRQVTSRVEKTHAPPTVDARPWVTLNAALEVDHTGAVNVEHVGRHISGIGGHPDFALLGHLSPGGLSVIAVPSTRRGRPTLVDRLSSATSTSRTDVDVVVTEHGAADLRGLDDHERASALTELWHRT